MKKGFTLIELLAVIVILAIITLIATPIILGIINDAREKANERSVELYASAVRNAIASYQLTSLNAPKSFDDLTIEYDGNVVCETEELYEDGSFYITGCTVNGIEVEYTYGEKQVTRYYSWDLIGSVGQTVAPEEAERLTVPPTGKELYLGYEVDKDGIVSTVYACFRRNEIEYCLKGNDDSLYETNKSVIEEAFKDVENACYSGMDGTVCNGGNLRANVEFGGFVSASISDGPSCNASAYSFECRES